MLRSHTTWDLNYLFNIILYSVYLMGEGGGGVLTNPEDKHFEKIY